MAKVHNPKTTHFEFFGPPGATVVSATVPLIIYGVNFACSPEAGNVSGSLSIAFSGITAYIGERMIDPSAIAAYIAFYAYTVAAWYFLPGEWIEGTELRNGERLKYKMNALSSLMLTLSLVAGWIALFGASSFVFIYDHWVGICTAAIVNAITQATYCYLASLWNEKTNLMTLAGNTGVVVYDWFIGRELNSRIGSFDLKSFNEFRPTLVVLNSSGVEPGTPPIPCFLSSCFKADI
ncbi:C-14 sterol reductase ERG24 [Ceratobasidium sp. AG-Ba]|nr:C-14 sterol reductase ERG24 [Ceratobasidium sp. AG-Ba]